MTPARVAAMRPTSVRGPVATAIPSPLPPTTLVPEKAIDRRSASGADPRVRRRCRPARAATRRSGRCGQRAGRARPGSERQLERCRPPPAGPRRRPTTSRAGIVPRRPIATHAGTWRVGLAKHFQRALGTVGGRHVGADDGDDPDEDQDAVADLAQDDRPAPPRRSAAGRRPRGSPPRTPGAGSVRGTASSSLGPELGQAQGGLGRGQPDLRIDAELGGDRRPGAAVRRARRPYR